MRQRGGQIGLVKLIFLDESGGKTSLTRLRACARETWRSWTTFRFIGMR